MENNLFYGNAGSATFAINLVCFKRTISIEPRVGRQQSPESSLIMGVLNRILFSPKTEVRKSLFRQYRDAARVAKIK